MPIVLRHAISGVAQVNTEDPRSGRTPRPGDADRCLFRARLPCGRRLHRIEVPERVDLPTGLIKCRMKKVYRIQIRFQGSEIRRG